MTLTLDTNQTHVFFSFHNFGPLCYRIPHLILPDVERKFPEITDFFDINNMQVQELINHLHDMGLSDKVDQVMRMAEELYNKLQQEVRGYVALWTTANMSMSSIV